MKLLKIAALACGLTIAAAAGAAFIPVAHGQMTWDGDEPFAQTVQVFRNSGRIGVTLRDQEETDTKPASAGVTVDEVTSGSPADKAGIKAGDAIVDFDGERVRSVRQFQRLVSETPTGRKVSMTLLRGGQRVTVSVAPERGSSMHFDLDRPFAVMPPEPPEAPEPPRPPKAPSLPGFDFLYRSGNGRLGASVEDLSEGLSDYFGVKHGVLVRSVTDGSAAAKAGLKAGDVITAINGSQVEDASDVSRAINRADEEADLTIDVMRDKKPQTLKGKLEKRDRIRSRTRTIV
jgi:serine protease Do